VSVCAVLSSQHAQSLVVRSVEKRWFAYVVTLLVDDRQQKNRSIFAALIEILFGF
jgi:hypothetical protein